MWVLNKSDGPLVHTLSPSNPITLLHMFIFGSNGLLAIIISPLKKKKNNPINTVLQLKVHSYILFLLKKTVFLHIQHVPSLDHWYVLTDWNPLFYFAKMTTHAFREDNIMVDNGGLHGRTRTLKQNTKNRKKILFCVHRFINIRRGGKKDWSIILQSEQYEPPLLLRCIQRHNVQCSRIGLCSPQSPRFSLTHGGTSPPAAQNTTIGYGVMSMYIVVKCPIHAAARNCYSV